MMPNLTLGRLADLDAELRAIPHLPAGGALLAVPIDLVSGNRLLRGINGEACVLIAREHRIRHANLMLRNIQVQSAVSCEVEALDGSHQHLTGTMITCRSLDPLLRQLFLSVIEDGLRSLGKNPTNTEITLWLQQLSMLFAKLEIEGRKKLRGLWAELVAMIALGNPEEVARRWHSDPNDTFDFTAGAFGIEVKSCQDLARIHHFSLSQLRPPDEQTVWLMSIVVRPDPKGSTVLEMLAEVESGISDADTRSIVRAMTLSIGGQALEENHLHRFDRTGAISTARLIDVRSVPSVSEELPQAIRSVTLEIECRDLPPAGDPASALARMAGA